MNHLYTILKSDVFFCKKETKKKSKWSDNLSVKIGSLCSRIAEDYGLDLPNSMVCKFLSLNPQLTVLQSQRMENLMEMLEVEEDMFGFCCRIS
jgi:hypothetical protein